MPRLSVRFLALIFSFSTFLVIFSKQVSANYTEDNLLAAINEFRQSKGLTPIRSDPYTCSFARLRAKEVSGSFSHTGFYSRVNDKTLPYPRYKQVTENLAWAPGGKNPVKMWINSPTHAANMQKNTPIVCVSNYGDYYAYEGWQS